MKKNTLLKLVTLSCATCLTASIFVYAKPAQAVAEEVEPSSSIYAQTLLLEDTIRIRYAVDFKNVAEGDKTGLLVWTTPQTEYVYGETATVVTNSQEVEIEGGTYSAFSYTELSAKQMTDVVYASAYIERDGLYYYSNVKKYSILEYAYNKLGKTESEPTEDVKLKALLNAMLSYGAAAQTYFEYNTDNLATADGFTYVRIANAHFSDGFDYGLFKAGSTVTVTPDDGYYFSPTEDSTFTKNEDGTYSFIVPESKTIDVTSLEKYSVGLEYKQNTDGTYQVIGVGDCTDTEIVIPSVYSGKGVTSIGDYAFYGCNALESITLPSGITSIGDHALSYNGLTSVIIPDSVTSVGDYTFWSCSSLKSVTLSNGLTCIAKGMFETCESLESITLPSNITSIGESAFSDCKSLTSIIIPENVTTIGDYAFWYCNDLTNVTIPKSVTSIGVSAFDNYSYGTITFNGTQTEWKAIEKGDAWNRNYTIVYSEEETGSDGGETGGNTDGETTVSEGLSYEETDGTYKVYGIGDCTDTDVVIPSAYKGKAVTSIGTSAFQYSTLTSVTIPDSVTSIGAIAFQVCNKLTSVTIGKGVKTIGSYAFSGCSALTTITYNGTKAEWANITKNSGWNDSVPQSCTIVCTDGNISITE